jgi:hypothetical protein
MPTTDDAEIRLVVQLTEQDVLAADRLWVRRHRTSRFALTSSAFLAFTFALLACLRGLSITGIALGALLGPIFYILIIYGSALMAPRITRQNYLNRAGLRRPTTYIAGADGLAISQEGYSEHFAWHQLPRWGGDDRYLIVFRGGRMYFILPVRAFDEGDAERLRRRLEAAGVPRY